MSGFIVMQREALDHPLLKDGERFRAWFWLLAKACWRPTKFDISGKIVVLRRGQLVASRAQLAAAWGWSPSAVERFLTRLETEQMIGRATGQGRTIITICNYGKYQNVDGEAGQATGQETGQPSDSDRTTKEPLNHGTNIEEPKGSRASGDAPRSELTPDIIVSAWNDLAQRTGLPSVRSITKQRRQHIAARLKEYPNIDDWVEALAAIERSPFLLGLEGRAGWRASFDFLLQPSSFAKLIEGTYDRKSSN